MNASPELPRFQELLHELANLLAGIRWSADVLLARLPPTTDHREIEQIRVAAEQATELALRLANGVEPVLSTEERGPRSAHAEPGDPVPAETTVLLVEDSNLLRPLMRRVLESHGYRVLEAVQADAALELARRHPDEIHLLISDVVLPGASGIRIAEEIRDLCPEISVLLVSGALPDPADLLRIEGMQGFLVKPFTLEELLRRAREALRRGSVAHRAPR